MWQLLLILPDTVKLQTVHDKMDSKQVITLNVGPPTRRMFFYILLFRGYWYKYSCAFLHPVPLCMQFRKFRHPLRPAHNSLLFQKAERVLTCAQVCSCNASDGLRG